MRLSFPPVPSVPVIMLIMLSSPLGAQGPAPGPDRTVDAATRAQVLDGVLKQLDGAYVFPVKAKEMEQAVRARAKRGEYDRLTSARAFADTLTEHLQAVSRDKHLKVLYSARPVPDEPPDAEPSAEQARETEAFGKLVNFGIERAERLPGNVGYLEIRSFGFSARMADAAVAAAMNLLGNTDALIIDVRRNGGGDPDMVALVCSYLLGPGEILINRFYWRPQDRWDEFRTKATVSGRHYGTTKPVYVLTSNRTFSGAEEFAYDVQTQKRAEIVGDTTGGGAHPGGMRRVTEHFGVWVPSGRAVNPVTNTNWEGTGVRPDVPVNSEEALRTAHIRALEKLLSGATGEQKERLQEALERVRKGTA
ncbi:MAG TPA: S41 family peptidase [Gemmatimonadales bacterium]|nr:S41 family peptidase [Gemmatimonadales bacterium]